MEPWVVAERKGWYRPRELPHFDGDVTQAVTFRLANSLPASILREHEAIKEESSRRRFWEASLDAGLGERWLADPEIAELVSESIRFVGRTRCQLHAWVVMPTHVHLVMTPLEEHNLPDIIKNLKSYTSLSANRILGRAGPFWAREYFDRFIRDEDHFWAAVEYVHRNPVKAGLCKREEDWRWSSAFREPGRPEVDLPGDSS